MFTLYNTQQKQYETKKRTIINKKNNNNNNKMMSSIKSPPPWEILDLVSHHLDPKTLAIASCVSKTWYTCFSSDHLWDPLCAAAFPSLVTTLSSVAASLPRFRLYGLGLSAALRRQRKPRKPRLSLDCLMFIFSVRLPGGVVEVVKPCNDMHRDPHGMFRFDVAVAEEEREWTLEDLRKAKVTWMVAERDWKAVFTVAEESTGKLASGVEGFFSAELPSPGCCSGRMSSGLVADIRFGLKDQDEKFSTKMSRIEKVSVGIMSILSWRYISLEDGLLYLDHFLPGRV